MSDNSSNSKRIAKNTVMLYIRMLLSMVVSLYTSRVVLQTLGVEDYGIYGIVGGVLGMFSFLNAAMSGATSRFLSYEIGKAKRDVALSSDSVQAQAERNDYIPSNKVADSSKLTPLEKTFSSAMIIHMGVALVVFVLAMTIGLWFLNNKLVIPDERMTAAHWVYVCSILSMFLSVTQVPYNASIIAHEKMDVYAYVELLHVFLKLGIVYLLLLCDCDKLILYAFLMLGVSVIVALTYRIYCLKHYNETHFHWILDKKILKPMLNFTGWDLLGHFGFSFRTQGANMVINMFFGAAVNAAGSLASTVQSILYNFSGNVITAMKPQIIKRYSVGDYSGMSKLIYFGTKISLLMIIVMTVPAVVNISFVLQLWLKDVPKYTVDFCEIMLWANLVSSVSQIIYCGIQATGDLKKTSIIRNIIYIGTPFIIYFVFILNNQTPVWAYIVILISQIIMSLCDVVILSSKLTSIRISRILWICAKVVIVVAVTFVLAYWVSELFTNKWVDLFVSILTSTILILLAFLYFVFDNDERAMTISYLTNIKRKFIK